MNQQTDKAILVVSFGTSYEASRKATIEKIEQDIRNAFQDHRIYRAWTSKFIISILKKRDNYTVPTVKEALEQMITDGIREVVVQPTHLMNGLEYNDLKDELAGYSDSFEKIVLGDPLLTSDDDFQKVMNAIVDATKEYDDGETAICFMGHGTEADSNSVYTKMQETLKAAGYDNYFVGTVEATPSLDDVIAAVKAGGYKKVVLRPLMIVAGDHANNDMAGDEDGSWKTEFEKAGFEVTP